MSEQRAEKDWLSASQKVDRALHNVDVLRSRAVASGAVDDAAWLDDAAAQLRRARFHECENYARWQAAEAELGRVREALRRISELHAPTSTTAVASASWPSDGDLTEIQPDSFEEIVSRDVNCMACAGFPSAPCETYALATDGGGR